jgi:hypothetical protein
MLIYAVLLLVPVGQVDTVDFPFGFFDGWRLKIAAR